MVALLRAFLAVVRALGKTKLADDGIPVMGIYVASTCGTRISEFASVHDVDGHLVLGCDAMYRRPGLDHMDVIFTIYAKIDQCSLARLAASRRVGHIHATVADAMLSGAAHAFVNGQAMLSQDLMRAMGASVRLRFNGQALVQVRWWEHT